MEIHFRPEVEALIRQDVQRGAYQTIDEYIEHAVSMLHEHEAWLAAHQPEIAAKISEGYAAAQRGELLDPGEARSRVNVVKQAVIVSRGVLQATHRRTA
jgi:Arc/MetJ-type ribon-helix-helix transcriptional regulator